VRVWPTTHGPGLQQKIRVFLWSKPADERAQNPILGKPQTASECPPLLATRREEHREIHPVSDAMAWDRPQTEPGELVFDFTVERHEGIHPPEESFSKSGEGQALSLCDIPIGTAAGWPDHDGLPSRAAKDSNVCR
jgi:hypothetical protein